MLKWILQNLEIVAVIVLFIAQMVRAMLKSRKTGEPRESAPHDYDEERRIREVQEQVRRQIAARRGEQPSPATPPVLTPMDEPPPLPRTETTQMPEPFGGPLGRMLEELQRKAQSQSRPEPSPQVVVARSTTAEIERQQRLVEELRVAEENKLIARRRAAHLAADQEAAAQSEPALRVAAHDRLLSELRDVHSVRRAIVLREVLGTPVGLR